VCSKQTGFPSAAPKVSRNLQLSRLFLTPETRPSGTALRCERSDLGAGTVVLLTTAVSAELFIHVMRDCQTHMLRVPFCEIKATHPAVVVALLFGPHICCIYLVPYPAFLLIEQRVADE
jgi:hypothetical protein